MVNHPQELAATAFCGVQNRSITVVPEAAAPDTTNGFVSSSPSYRTRHGCPIGMAEA
jgi:hypothetical protein